MSVYAIEIIVAAVLMVAMLAINRLPEGKKRFLLLCALGTVVWLMILAGAIYLKQTRIAVFVLVMLVAYIASLGWLYTKIGKKR